MIKPNHCVPMNLSIIFDSLKHNEMFPRKVSNPEIGFLADISNADLASRNPRTYSQGPHGRNRFDAVLESNPSIWSQSGLIRFLLIRSCSELVQDFKNTLSPGPSWSKAGPKLVPSWSKAWLDSQVFQIFQPVLVRGSLSASTGCHPDHN